MEKTMKKLEKTLIISINGQTGKGVGKNPLEITPLTRGLFPKGIFTYPSLSPFLDNGAGR